MSVKSISYESSISSLIDVFALADGREHDLAIKRSFTTKQSIFSDHLHQRLLDHLSGQNQTIRSLISNMFNVIEEAMKDLCSSPIILNMSIETYNKEFVDNIIVPFTSLLLFSMRFDFDKTSPIYYLIDFISKNKSIIKTTLDASIREYVTEQLKSCNLPDGVGEDFKIFIGKISIKSALKPKTIETKIEELKSECIWFNNHHDLTTLNDLSLALQGMRIALCFKEHINDLVHCYNHAKQRTKNKDIAHWDALNLLSNEIIIKNKKGTEAFFKKRSRVISRSLELADKYHEGIATKYHHKPNDLLNYILDGVFYKEHALNLIQKHNQPDDKIYQDILDANIKIQDGEFELARNKIKAILDELENKPLNRITSLLSKLNIALTIKIDGHKIKNNNLESAIYQAIIADRSRTNVIFSPNVAFNNQESLFSQSPSFYTIIDSLTVWHDYIKDLHGIDVRESPEHDIEFTEKLENILNILYESLDKANIDILTADDESLKQTVKSALTGNETIDTVITCIPNLTLYFALREINSIYLALSARMMYKSKSITRFVREPQSSKRKLLKAISTSDYVKDEENERNI